MIQVIAEVNEFFDSDNAQIAYELRNENGSLLAEYSRYQPGTPESYVRVKLPTDRTTLFYRNNPFNQNKLYAIWYGKIELDSLTYESIGILQ